jgi:hypothetical protein
VAKYGAAGSIYCPLFGDSPTFKKEQAGQGKGQVVGGSDVEQVHLDAIDLPFW